MDFGQTPKNLARDDVESICQVFHFMVSLGLFGESIELTFETTNQRSAMLLRPLWHWFTCDDFACRWGSRICADSAATSHGVLKDTFRQNFSLLGFEAMREAICIHIGQGGANFSSCMIW